MVSGLLCLFSTIVFCISARVFMAWVRTPLPLLSQDFSRGAQRIARNYKITASFIVTMISLIAVLSSYWTLIGEL